MRRASGARLNASMKAAYKRVLGQVLPVQVLRDRLTAHLIAGNIPKVMGYVVRPSNVAAVSQGVQLLAQLAIRLILGVRPHSTLLTSRQLLPPSPQTKTGYLSPGPSRLRVVAGCTTSSPRPIGRCPSFRTGSQPLPSSLVTLGETSTHWQRRAQ